MAPGGIIGSKERESSVIEALIGARGEPNGVWRLPGD